MPFSLPQGVELGWFGQHHTCWNGIHLLPNLHRTALPFEMRSGELVHKICTAYIRKHQVLTREIRRIRYDFRAQIVM